MFFFGWFLMILDSVCWMFLMILDGFWMFLIILDGVSWFKKPRFQTEVCQKDQCPGHRRAQICWRCPEALQFSTTSKCQTFLDVGVSKNSGTPKWMVYNGKPLLKWMIWGYHYFWKHPCIIIAYAIASMGWLYILPTWMVDVCGKCR